MLPVNKQQESCRPKTQRQIEPSSKLSCHNEQTNDDENVADSANDLYINVASGNIPKEAEEHADSSHGAIYSEEHADSSLDAIPVYSDAQSRPTLNYKLEQGEGCIQLVTPVKFDKFYETSFQSKVANQQTDKSEEFFELFDDPAWKSWVNDLNVRVGFVSAMATFMVFVNYITTDK